jgi:hypothetical protein
MVIGLAGECTTHRMGMCTSPPCPSHTDLVCALVWLAIRTIVGDTKFPSFPTHSRRKSVHKRYNYVADKLAFERQVRTSFWDAREPENHIPSAVLAHRPLVPSHVDTQANQLPCCVRHWVAQTTMAHLLTLTSFIRSIQSDVAYCLILVRRF